MIRVITLFSILSVLFAVLSGAAIAQPPVQFNSSAEALKQYQASTLESLMERCVAVKTDNYLLPEEALVLRNGYVNPVAQDPRTGLYSIFVFDQDKRSFILVDGQLLGKGGQLFLRLALPRDYARCRVARDSTGAERLEAVHTERNYVSDAQKFQRLIKEAVNLTGSSVPEGAVVCSDSKTPDFLAPRLLVDGKTVKLSACNESLVAVRERMGRLIRKVYER